MDCVLHKKSKNCPIKINLWMHKCLAKKVKLSGGKIYPVFVICTLTRNDKSSFYVSLALALWQATKGRVKNELYFSCKTSAADRGKSLRFSGLCDLLNTLVLVFMDSTFNHSMVFFFL